MYTYISQDYFMNVHLTFQLRQFQTSSRQLDIDQAAKYIGAGAATVGVAGSGM
jgi:F-type H+-transporting ATPase subunit c